ncbi:MAG: hypothetical protein EVA65_15620 [Oceanococcus sp.]|nr:MAG: hypothetical protein EVA65_15620 [Oceanococcus sp.]
MDKYLAQAIAERQARERQAVEPQQEDSQNEGWLGDFVDSVQGSFARMLGSDAEFVGTVGESETAMAAADKLYDWADSMESTLSADALEARQKKFTEDGWKDADAWVNLAGQGVGSLAAMIATGGPLKGLFTQIGKAGMKKVVKKTIENDVKDLAARGATEAEIKREMKQRTKALNDVIGQKMAPYTGATGYGAAGGAMIGGSSAQQTREEFENAPIDQLMAVDGFADTLSQIQQAQPNLTSDEQEQLARFMFGREYAKRNALIGATIGAVTGPVTGKLVSAVGGRELAAGAGKGFLKGAAIEGGTEVAQEVPMQMAANQAAQVFDPNRSIMENTLEAGVTGFAGGALAGGPLGAAGGIGVTEEKIQRLEADREKLKALSLRQPKDMLEFALQRAQGNAVDGQERDLLDQANAAAGVSSLFDAPPAEPTAGNPDAVPTGFDESQLDAMPPSVREAVRNAQVNPEGVRPELNVGAPAIDDQSFESVPVAPPPPAALPAPQRVADAQGNVGARSDFEGGDRPAANSGRAPVGQPRERTAPTTYQIENATDKSFLVRGEPDELRTFLKGGVYSGERGGIVFPNKMRQDVYAAVQAENARLVESRKPTPPVEPAEPQTQQRPDVAPPPEDPARVVPVDTTPESSLEQDAQAFAGQATAEQKLLQDFDPNDPDSVDTATAEQAGTLAKTTRQEIPGYDAEENAGLFSRSTFGAPDATADPRTGRAALSDGEAVRKVREGIRGHVAREARARAVAEARSYGVTRKADLDAIGDRAEAKASFNDNDVQLGEIKDAKTAQALDRVGRLFGKTIRVVRLANDANFFDGVTFGANEIYISESSTKPVFSVVMHEMLHAMRKGGGYRRPGKQYSSPEDYESDLFDELKRVVAPKIKSGAVKRYARDARIEGYDDAYVTEEMIADFFGDQGSTPEFWAELQRELDPTTFQRIIDLVKEYVDKALSALGPNPMGSDQYINDLKSLRAAAVKAAAGHIRQQREDGFADPTVSAGEVFSRSDRAKIDTQAVGETDARITPTTDTRELPNARGVRGSAGLLEQPGRAPAQDAGREADGSLRGLPRNVGRYTASVWQPAVETARRYAESAGIDYNPPNEYARVEPARAARIADAYDAMEHAPQDPEVAAAYDAMIAETEAQYQAVLDSGLQVEFIDFDRQGDPYEESPRAMTDDVRQNNHMYVFSTRDGFGSDDTFDPVDNPLLRETQFTDANGQPMLVNDLFRVVHDYFGHVKEGVGFRAAGEENAWRAHSAMYSPLARKAMTSETRGQNSWVNYGPHGEFNRTASAADTHYADQKIGLLPGWVVEDGASDEPMFSRARVERITEGEADLLTKQGAEKLQQLLEGLPAKEDFAAAALAGQAKRGWYKGSEQAIAHVFGVDAPRFVALLAALSPQTSVESNLKNTLNVWNAWDRAGRPTDKPSILRIMGENVEGDRGEASVLDAWKNNSLTALQAEEPSVVRLSGPKVDSFMRNLLGDQYEVTNDAWMATFANVDQELFGGINRKRDGVELKGLKGAGYIAASVRTREAADYLTETTGETWTPAEVQETVWSWAKALYESMSVGDDPVQKANELTDDIINAVPDFGGLLKGEFNAYLTDDQKRRVEGYRPAESRSGGQAGAAIGPDRSRLAVAAARVGKVKAERDRQSAINDLRGRFSEERGGGADAKPRPYVRGSGRPGRTVGGRVLRGTRWFEPAKDFGLLEKHGITAPAIAELPNTGAAAAVFLKAIKHAKRVNDFGAAVHAYRLPDYLGMRLFLSEDGTSGFALKGDDIVSVFNTKGSPNKRFTVPALMLAVQEGGRRLDAFDTGLGDVYAALGFRKVASVPWAEKHKPAGWQVSKLGRPAVLHMVHEPLASEKLKRKDAAFKTSQKQSFDYDKAVAEQDRAVAERDTWTGGATMFSRRQPNQNTKTSPPQSGLFDGRDLPASDTTEFTEAVKAARPEDVPMFKRAYHGTPHRFDKFSLDAVGTGEGAQAYGWGLYFAERRSIAEWYRDTLSEPTAVYEFRGKPVDKVYNGDISETWADVVEGHDEDWESDFQYVMANISQVGTAADIRHVLEYFDDAQMAVYRDVVEPELVEAEGSEGNLFQVDIPEDHELLDWDAPLSEQPKVVRDALGEVINEYMSSPKTYKPKEVQNRARDAWTGEQVYEALKILDGTDRAASQRLNDYGIKGLRYRDNQSRKSLQDPEAPRNYVIWDEDAVTIEAVNDELVQALEQAHDAPMFKRSSTPTVADDVFGAHRDASPLGEEGTMERLKRNFLDNMSRLRGAQKHLQNLGVDVTDDADGYTAETLYYGKTDKALRDLDKKHVQPLLNQLRLATKAGIPMKAIDDYLIATHAHERNDKVAEVNSKFPDGGSGMKNAEATRILNLYDGNRKQILERIAARVYAMNNEALQLKVDAGLIDPDAAAAMSETYQHYVPLETVDFDPESGTGIGMGYDVRGQEVKRAMGRVSRPTSPTVVSVMNAQRAIIRANKAEVGRAVYNLAQKESQLDLDEDQTPVFEIVGEEGLNTRRISKRTYDVVRDPATGRFTAPDAPEGWLEMPNAKVVTRNGREVVEITDTVNAPDVQGYQQSFAVKVDGEVKYVKVNDAILASQLKKMGAQELNGFMRGVGAGTRFLSRMYTQFNPSFTIVNAVRDAITAGLNSLGYEDVSTRKTMTGIPKAWKGITDHTFGSGQSEWAKHYEDFLNAGGSTGNLGMDTIRDLTSRLKDEFDIDPDTGEKLTGAKAAKAQAGRVWSRILDGVSNVNNVAENAARLAFFVEARESGYSTQQAAHMAKELTVNFNKKGEFGQQLNALYIFFNAAMQGNRALVEHWRKNPVAVGKGIATLGALGIVAQVMNMAFGDDEETGEAHLNKISDYENDHSIVFLTNEDGSRVKVPLPYGYNVAYVAARRTADMFLGDGDINDRVFKNLIGIGGSMLESFSPLGGTTSGDRTVSEELVRYAMPTLGQGFVDTSQNRDRFGVPIARRSQYDALNVPESQKYYRGVSEIAKGITQALHEMSGGTATKPGLVEINPEHLDYWAKFILGGVGSTATGLSQLAGDEPSINRAPVVKSVYGGPSEHYAVGRYYDVKADLDMVSDRLRDRDPDLTREERKAAIAFNNLEKQLRRLRKNRRNLEKLNRDTTDIERRIEDLQKKVVLTYNQWKG